MSNEGRLSIGANGVASHLFMSGLFSGGGDVHLYLGSQWTLMGDVMLPHSVGNMKMYGELFFDFSNVLFSYGTYTLLRYIQFAGLSQMSIAGVVYDASSRVNYALFNNDLMHEIQLKVNGDAATLTWNKGLSGLWDVRGMAWSYEQALTSDGRFFPQDHVVFKTKNAQVQLSGALQAGSVTVLEDVTFSGGSLQTPKLMIAGKLGITSLQGVYKLGSVYNIHHGVLELKNGVQVEAQEIIGNLGLSLDVGERLTLSGFASFGAIRNDGTLVFDLENRLWSHGVYTLATYESWQGDGEIQLEGFIFSEDSRVNYFLENKQDEHKIELSVDGSAAQLIWNQGGESIWDLRGTEWGHEARILDGRFYHNDHVMFHTAGAKVDIIGVVKSGGMTITESIRFTGERLECEGTLLKQGLGSLVFDNRVTKLRLLDLQAGKLEVSGQLLISGGATLASGTVLSLVSGTQHELEDINGAGASLVLGDEAVTSLSGTNRLSSLIGNKARVKSGNTLLSRVDLVAVELFVGATLSLDGVAHRIGTLSGTGNLSLAGNDTSLLFGEARESEDMQVQLGAGTSLTLGGGSSLGDVAGAGKLVFSGEILQMKSFGNALLQVVEGVV